jgi:hypothetical protein
VGRVHHVSDQVDLSSQVLNPGKHPQHDSKREEKGLSWTGTMQLGMDPWLKG